MGGKIFWVAVIVVGIIGTYILMAAMQPAILDIVETANQSTSNWDKVVGAQDALVSMPFWLWFIPVLVGGVAIVGILRTKK